MTRDEALAEIRSHETELRRAGLRALYLFGSTARGSASNLSDIDLLFEVGEAPRFSLLDQARLQVRLSELLKRDVDLLERSALRPRIRAFAESEMIQVF